MTKNEIHLRASAATDSSETRNKKNRKNPHFYKTFMLVSSSKPVDLFVLSLGKVSVFPGIQNSYCPKVRQMWYIGFLNFHKPVCRKVNASG